METWHPFVIHVPITLILFWPVLEAAGLISRSAAIDKLAGVAGGLAIACAVLATATGQLAFEAALDAGVDVEVLTTHAANANLMPWLLLLLAAARLGLGQKFGRNGRWAAVLLGLGLAVFVVVVGRSGGALVFEHAVGVAPR